MADGTVRRIRKELASRELRDRMVRVARSVLKDAEDSEDAAHDAVVAALSAAERYRGGAQVSTWLHRITVNAALMQRRKHKRAERKAEASRAQAEHLPWLASTDAAPLASTILEELEVQTRVRAALAALPPAYRSVMERHVVAEEAPPEVAAHLGLTLSAVRTRIGRARAQLQAALRRTPDGGAS